MLDAIAYRSSLERSSREGMKTPTEDEFTESLCKERMSGVEAGNKNWGSNLRRTAWFITVKAEFERVEL